MLLILKKYPFLLAKNQKLLLPFQPASLISWVLLLFDLFYLIMSFHFLLN